MDAASFNALYKFVARQHGDAPPPRLVLAVLTYLEGLGYEVVCRGDSAWAYACNGAGSGPVRRVSGSSQQNTQGTGDSSSYWYALDMVRDSNAGQLIDQMVVHVRMTTHTAYVHCSRTMWSGPKDPSGPATFQRVNVATSEVKAHTSCTLCDDDMLELHVGKFDDGAGLRNVEELCGAFQSFFCKGSARQAVEAPVSTAHPETVPGIRHPVEVDPTERQGIAAVGGFEDDDDLDRLRVGQSDLDPIDRRGAGRGLGPDGMMVGPHHPIFGRGRMEPPPGHEGHLPPGAHWDPIAPPGMPGFFPGDFERGRGRGRGRGAEDIHPDIMQPGRGGFGGGFDGFL